MSAVLQPIELPPPKPSEELDSAVIRFAGDSGDGMQLTGTQFTMTSALVGNDLATFPDFPAEIRAPAGTLAGVSGYQIHFASREVFTPGDAPDVLVVMNAAAFKVNINDLRTNGLIIADTAGFGEGNLEKVGYTQSPLDDPELAQRFRVYKIDISKLNATALQDLGLGQKDVQRCKNFFALGLVYWLYNRPMEPTVTWLKERFKNKPELFEANRRALNAGFNLGENAEIFFSSYSVKPAQLAPGTYRNITGNSAAALGFVTAARLAGRTLFLGSYPITPASDILHELSGYKNYGVITFQAEDEIAGVGSALGAAYGGAIGLTTTSGPGVDLKAETIGLAVSVELPLVICDIQRGGPSTGLPTKTEQADLLQAVYGRHGECPLPVIAAATPADCFAMAVEAVRLAVRYMTPVMFLTDGYLANGSEPWLLPDVSSLPAIEAKFRTDPQGFKVYQRNEETLARDWVVPGTPGLEHRIGGLEKDSLTGNVSYDPVNHEKMVRIRAEKIARIAREIPPVEVNGNAEGGQLLVIGWGSTYGAITQAVNFLRKQGRDVSSLHLHHLNPFPPNLEEVLGRFGKILVPELNLGQLSALLRVRFLTPTIGLNKVQGKPFMVSEIIQKIEEVLDDRARSC
jgi:2-oxoglutarate ferredoxin oxidoreductase subunit alpha